MRVRSIIVTGAALIPPLALAIAGAPPSFFHGAAPGGTYVAALTLHNPGDRPAAIGARGRLRALEVFSSPSRRSLHTPWIGLEREDLDPSGEVERDIEFPISEGMEGLFRAEVRAQGPGRVQLVQALPVLVATPHLGAAPLPDEGPVPFRLLAGDDARQATEESPDGMREEIARDGEAFADLRARLGMTAPPSWELDPQPEFGFPNSPARFAAPEAPDFSEETVLCLRTPDWWLAQRPLSFWVRSVEREADGTVVCRYSFRARRASARALERDAIPGVYLMIAIPRADGPIEFVRVP